MRCVPQVVTEQKTVMVSEEYQERVMVPEEVQHTEWVPEERVERAMDTEVCYTTVMVPRELTETINEVREVPMEVYEARCCVETVVEPREVTRTEMVPEERVEFVDVCKTVEKVVMDTVMETVCEPRQVSRMENVERCVEDHYTETRLLRYDPLSGERLSDETVPDDYAGPARGYGVGLQHPAPPLQRGHTAHAPLYPQQQLLPPYASAPLARDASPPRPRVDPATIHAEIERMRLEMVAMYGSKSSLGTMA